MTTPAAEMAMYDALSPDLRAAVAYYPLKITMASLTREVRKHGSRAVTEELAARCEPHPPCRFCDAEMLRHRKPAESYAIFRARLYCCRKCFHDAGGPRTPLEQRRVLGNV